MKVRKGIVLNHHINRNYFRPEQTRSLDQFTPKKGERVILYWLNNGNLFPYEGRTVTSNAPDKPELYSFRAKNSDGENLVLTLDRVEEINHHNRNLARVYRKIIDALSGRRKYLSTQQAQKIARRIAKTPENRSFYSDRESDDGRPYHLAREFVATLVVEGMLEEKAGVQLSKPSQ